MAGARHADIALVIGVSVPTLRKRFADDLAAGKAAVDLFAPGDAPRVQPDRPRPAAGGRPKFRPHDGHRRRVMELAAVGKPISMIANVLGLSQPTLRKHFAEELATGAEKVEADVIEALMRKARTGNVAALKEARAMIAQARLEGMEAALRERAPAPAATKVETPGKKLQAISDAAQVIDTADWAAHLRAH